MTDLYGLLGVKRSATIDEIRRAARRTASKAHPDHGGDAGAMAAVNHARDVLLDPVLRAAYDRGGDAAVKSATAAESQALQCLKQTWSQCLDQGLQAGIEVLDPMSAMRRMLGVNVAELRKNLERAQFTVKVLERQRRRLRRMTNGVNPFEDTIAERVIQCEQAIDQIKLAVAACDDAGKLLAEFKDDRPGVAPYQGFLTMLGGGGTTSSTFGA
jgi:DnaJ-class molecular chaperone